MTAVIHIGPPKTASTSIQNSLLPQLGLPFLVKPEWARELASPDDFTVPEVPANAVVSDEYLGEFLRAPPEVVCARLARVFPAGGRIVHVHRDPVALFSFYYRQKIVNTAAGAEKLLRGGMTPVKTDANAFFDEHVGKRRESGTGFMVMADSRKVRATFAARFEVVEMDFERVRTDSRRFAAKFCEACGIPAGIEISQDNVTSADDLESWIARAPALVPADIIAFWREAFARPQLSESRLAVLRELKI